MSKFWFFTIMTGLMATMGGCAGVGTPHVLHPGSVQQQQASAQAYEPYPDPNVGPNFAGSRPPGYESPRAEVLQVQPRLGEPLLTPCPPSGMAPAAANVAPPAVVPPPLPYGPPGPVQ